MSDLRGVAGGWEESGPDGRACWPEHICPSLRTLYEGGSDPAGAVPPSPSRPYLPLLRLTGSSSPLTGAWLSQQLDHGDIGEDDVALPHGLLKFHDLAAQGLAAMLLRRRAQG